MSSPYKQSADDRRFALIQISSQVVAIAWKCTISRCRSGLL
jgi:hypothetical protein